MTAASVHGTGVLVVDDDDDTRELVSAFLEATGYPVVTAKHGQEALGHLHEFAAPCLILLDLMMPVMDGWTFRREQLRDPMLATIPVIVITATHDARQAASALGAASYLEKPLDFRALARTVQQFC